MRSRRLIPFIAAIAVAAAACSSTSDREVQLDYSASGGPGVPVELAQQDGEPQLDPAAVASQATQQILVLEGALSTLLNGVDAECAARTDALDRASADLSDRTFIGPQDQRCAQLGGASFERARVEDVDFTGANLAGANLRYARLNIVGVGIDLSGADLTGADLTGSDLTGAKLTGATLVGSTLTGLVTTAPELEGLTIGGLTGADLTSAMLGCNQLEGAPLMTMVGVQFDDICTAENDEGRIDMTLTGSLAGADLTAMSFGRVHLVAKDFRGASLQNASLSDYGVLPRELLFVGANLAGIDLRNNTLDSAVFIEADLTNADLSGSVIEASSFVAADLTGTNFTDVRSEHNDYRGTTVAGTNFTDASLSWDDFSSATFEAPVIDGLVVVAVVCDGSTAGGADNGNSVRNFGLCTVGSALIF